MTFIHSFISMLRTAALNTPPPVQPEPRPKELVNIFKGKKQEIEAKLHDNHTENGTNHQRSATLGRESKRDRNDKVDNWIAMLKHELDERATSPKQSAPKAPIKLPTKSPFGEPRTTTDKADSAPLTSPPKTCIRCNQQVATVDRILLSGVLLHRACLTCSRCSITLRLSEVRAAVAAAATPNGKSPVGGGGGGTSTDAQQFNFLCILCSKNKANSNHSARPLTTASDTVDTPPSAVVDDYESKIKERIRWKEQFLLNNNTFAMPNFDAIISRAAAANAEVNKSAPTAQTDAPAPDASPAKTDKINERIEYENTSTSFELYDDDELTKLMNLDSEWESEDETT